MYRYIMMRKTIFILLLLIAGFAGEVYSQNVIEVATGATLAVACSTATDGQTVKMLADVEINSTVGVSNRIFTLDLNGKKITSNPSGNGKTFLQIGSGSDITITDSSVDQDGLITCVTNGGNMVPLVLLETGRLTVNAGNIVSPSNPTAGFCAVSVNDVDATLIINGGTLSTSKANSSAPTAVIYNLGTTIINGGTINNTNSGGVTARGIMNNGTLYVYGGNISSSEYAIYNYKKGTLSLRSDVGIDGDIDGYNNKPIDEYVLTDENGLNMMAAIAANTITYNRGSSNTFGTVCLPFVPDTKSTITYYTLKESTDNTLTLEEVDNFVANTPYIYYTEDGTYNVSKTSTTTLAANPVAGIVSNDNGWSLKGVYKRTSVFTSTSDADYDDTDASHVVEPNSYYIKNNGFSKTDGYVVVKPFRAYITAPDGAANSNHYEISVIDEATSVQSVLDGKQTILAIYDVNGVRLSRLQRGVNIVVMGNGKRAKIIVK